MTVYVVSRVEGWEKVLLAIFSTAEKAWEYVRCHPPLSPVTPLEVERWRVDRTEDGELVSE